MENEQNIKSLFCALMTQIYRRIFGSLYLHVPSFPRLHQPIIDRGAYVLRLSRSSFAISLYRYPKMEREDEEFLRHFLKSGMTYIDVGANIGTTTLMGAYAVGSTGKAIAFEPHPATFRDLTKSVALNRDLAPRITLVHTALGDTIGQSHISDLLDNDTNYLGVAGIPVAITTLDEALKDIPHVDLLKIDVEGYEKHVFLGAKETLAKTDAIYFENCEPNFQRFGYSVDDLFELLGAAGFSVYTVDKQNTFSLTEEHKGHRCEKDYENLVALARNAYCERFVHRNL
jgi:FkbM family methyltransferase